MGIRIISGGAGGGAGVSSLSSDGGPLRTGAIGLTSGPAIDIIDNGNNTFTITGTGVATAIVVNAATIQSILQANAGVGVKQLCDYATAAALPANTYANGAAGVGATLTANANGALTVDGQAVQVNQRVLVKNEAAAAHNGIYVVTQVGTAGTPYILTRATDYDGSAGGAIDANDLIGVIFSAAPGASNNNTLWLSTVAQPPTVGTTAIAWAQVPGSAAVIQSANLIAAVQRAATAYTFVQGDGNTVVEFTAAGAVTATVPPNSAVAFPIGTVIEVFQAGAGQVTIAAGVGVTLRSDAAKVKTGAQYATISLRKRGTDEWVLTGDLA